MDPTVIDFWNMIATFAAAGGAVYFAYKANKIAQQQTTIADQQKDIELRQFNAESKPALKFVVTARLGEGGDLAGYDFRVINHGKAPAVLNIPQFTDFKLPICQKRTLLQIKHGRIREDLKKALAVGTDDYHAASTRTASSNTSIGSFEGPWVNSVIVMPQEMKTFFHGSKKLSDIVKNHSSDYRLLNDLAFYVHESLDNQTYILTICEKKEEGLAMSVDSLDDVISEDNHA
ncbi:hypothetical protein [Lacticaseibacillus kribbianus]|uniref:hypothetical protein n=1 Tax=Lacticaseibacillus kribbianus TaxID=2926292 RepID=UPI001CD256EB|nr:hypothetical protein [Lacticaseibacillus kribbianus]